MMTHDGPRAQRPSSQRNCLFDAIRGFSVVSMVLFHLVYDLAYLFDVPVVWFAPPLIDIWRASISWAFLFVAGVMCSYSRSNLRRGLRYMALAVAIWVATTVAAVDTPINFGIIFCMAASTLIFALLERLHVAPRGFLAAALLFAGYLLTFNLRHGYLGFVGVGIRVPAALYQTPYLSWLGMPGPRFASGDYYPVLPFTLMYLCGASCGARWKSSGYPVRVFSPVCRPLELVGRHPLLVYVLHQPLLLGACSLVFVRLPL